MPVAWLLRLVAIHGDIKDWNVGPLEDLRECSHNQINEYIDEIDWLINVLALSFQRHQHQPEDPELFQPNQAHPQRRMGLSNVLQCLHYLINQEVKKICSNSQSMSLQNRHHRGKSSNQSLIKTSRPSDRITIFDEFDEFYNDSQFWSRRATMRRPSDFYLDYMIGLIGIERLWHSPASGFTSLLRRSGTSREVIALARQAIGCCAICRKYVRLPNRPQDASSWRQRLQPSSPDGSVLLGVHMVHPAESELAQEPAMAHNITLSYGGVTPAMAVYGTLPRVFYNPESEHVTPT